MSLEVTAYWESHIGKARQSNEDRCLIQQNNDTTLFLVADGLGGNSGGDRAAEILVETFNNTCFSPKNINEQLSQLVFSAEKKMFAIAEEEPGLYGMGSTLTLLLLWSDQAYWIHVGDSRLYLFRQDHLQQLSRDHTFLQEYIDDGTLTALEAKEHPFKDVLDQCVGCGYTEPQQGAFRIESGDKIFLCSDGLTEHIVDEEITSVIQGAKSTQEKCQTLLLRCLEEGGRDNITIILAEVQDVF